MEARTESLGPARSVAARLHINQRSLQIVLGVVWIFDGLLKFQPNVLKSAFLPTFIQQMAVGQPADCVRLFHTTHLGWVAVDVLY